MQSPTDTIYEEPPDRESGFPSEWSLDTFSQNSYYTWGPQQPEEQEPEPVPSSQSRLRCRKCNKRFENAYSLEQHAKVFGHRIFVCPMPGCDQSYTRRDSWTRHKKSHNLELKCPLCPENGPRRTFKRKDHLLTHQRNCHPEACGSLEVPGVSKPAPPAQAPGKCSCPCSKGSSTSSSGEARGTFQDIVEIKREHQDERQVLREIEKVFDLDDSSTKEQVASILANLVVPQNV